MALRARSVAPPSLAATAPTPRTADSSTNGGDANKLGFTAQTTWIALGGGEHAGRARNTSAARGGGETARTGRGEVGTCASAVEVGVRVGYVGGGGAQMQTYVRSLFHFPADVDVTRALGILLLFLFRRLRPVFLPLPAHALLSSSSPPLPSPPSSCRTRRADGVDSRAAETRTRKDDERAGLGAARSSNARCGIQTPDDTEGMRRQGRKDDVVKTRTVRGWGECAVGVIGETRVN
ncbi:hypothetical protein C8J57DRAFT_1534655 [Mycena rebaudengoi]|nr:hypothetical protein C8J57DRAFT_1534655 [Mycena rebaudengoi]